MENALSPLFKEYPRLLLKIELIRIFKKAKILGIQLLLILKRCCIRVGTWGSQLSTTLFVANCQTSQGKSFPSSHYTQDSCDICF